MPKPKQYKSRWQCLECKKIWRGQGDGFTFGKDENGVAVCWCPVHSPVDESTLA